MGIKPEEDVSDEEGDYEEAYKMRVLTEAARIIVDDNMSMLPVGIIAEELLRRIK